MRTEIEILERKKIIRDVSVVSLNEDDFVGMPSNKVEHLKTSEKNADTYRFTYLSDGLKVVGFISLPKKIDKNPCIIYNRGGSFDFGKITPALAIGRLANFASWGYITIGSQYRGNDGGEGKEEHGGHDLNDVLKLREILKNIPGADGRRIGMFGASRGGLMTYLALAKVRWVRAAVTIAGTADEVRSVQLRPKMRKVMINSFGGSRKGLRARSAVCWPEKFSKKTPLLMMHGTADWRVSPLDSLDLARLLYAQKIPFKLIMFEGDDHGLTKNKSESLMYTREWFDRFVKNSEKLPNLKPLGD